MLRVLQILVGWIALGFDAVAMACFGDWFTKTDWLMGHTYGPPSSIIAALWTAIAGVIGTAIWVVIALFRRFWFSNHRQEKLSRWPAIQGLILVMALGPAGIIVAVGATESPRARRELQVQRIQAGEASVAELVEALRSPDSGLRYRAVQELERMGPQAKAAVPALAEVLENPTEVSGPGTVVTGAAQALAAIGPEAEPAIPALVEAVKREGGRRPVRDADAPSILSSFAGKALANIGPASIPELITLLAHEAPHVRMIAATSLGDMGPRAEHAIPALKETLNDEHESVRRRARVALDRIENRRPVAR